MVIDFKSIGRWLDFSQHLISRGYSYLDNDCLICADKSTVKCEDGLNIIGNIFTALYNKDEIVVTFLGNDNKVAEDLVRSYLVFKSDKIKSEISIRH